MHGASKQTVAVDDGFNHFVPSANCKYTSLWQNEQIQTPTVVSKYPWSVFFLVHNKALVPSKIRCSSRSRGNIKSFRWSWLVVNACPNFITLEQEIYQMLRKKNFDEYQETRHSKPKLEGHLSWQKRKLTQDLDSQKILDGLFC